MVIILKHLFIVAFTLGVPARDQDHDRARTHVPARDPVVIVRARVHHGAADPAARVPVPEINIVTRNASLFLKIEPSQNLDRALGREADKRVSIANIVCYR